MGLYNAHNNTLTSREAIVQQGEVSLRILQVENIMNFPPFTLVFK